jgi:hypothetical protein
MRPDAFIFSTFTGTIMLSADGRINTVNIGFFFGKGQIFFPAKG